MHSFEIHTAQVENGVYTPNVREESVAQALALVSSFHQSSNVNDI